MGRHMKVLRCDIANGPGFRTSVWMSRMHSALPRLLQSVRMEPRRREAVHGRDHREDHLSLQPPLHQRAQHTRGRAA